MVFKSEKYSRGFVTGKFLILLPILCILIACNEKTREVQQMQLKIDSLQKQLDKTYKPGLGEFMTGIQLHHAKLWFAGQNQNWPLADFEIHEILESLDDIEEFCKDRPEVKSIGMIKPAIDSVTDAIRRKDLPLFKNSFSLLTNTCNNCHKATDHGFNIVMTPVNPPVSNQDFRVAQ
jgi:hypothetical protein